jgi:hypothetical protein
MMIRRAIPTDIHRLMAMGQAFFIEAGWRRHAEFDAESFAYTCGLLMDHGVFLVAENDDGVVGMVAAGISPAYWNRKVLTGQELFWYVLPEHRTGTGGLLMAGLENAMKSLGVVLCSMSAEEGLRSNALHRLYRLRGYWPAEKLFWKRLEGAVA